MMDSFILEAYGRICSSLSIEQSLGQAYRFLKEKFPADGAFIDIYLESLHQIRFLALVDGERVERFNQPIMLTKQMEQHLKRADRPDVLHVTDIQSDPVTLQVAKQISVDMRSFVILRLKLDDQRLGVVAFYSKQYNAFSKEHENLLGKLHDPFALVVANALHPILQVENISLRNRNEQLQPKLIKVVNAPLANFLQTTPALKPVAEKIVQIAPYETTVWITGETGSGKEVVANIIHQISPRANAPFIKVNCGAIPETLIDSELFGHEKGAFTDAKRTHFGYFEQADGGSLLLDEIAELPLSAQVRLLRVLQHKTITRVGGSRPITLDIRIIAATHKPLETLVKNGRFREDLWYRLNVFPIAIPPLRERLDDILPLATNYLKKLQQKYNLPYLPRLAEKSLQLAQTYPWRGNVRELENLLERAVLQGDTKTITLTFPTLTENTDVAPSGGGRLKTVKPFDEMMRDYFCDILKICNGKISGKGGAAEKLGLHPNTLRSRLQKLGILSSRPRL